jgi:4-carboxymuconolactone decarboxylase
MPRIPYVDTFDADPRVLPVFEEYEARTGSVPNLIRALARDPDLLEALLPLFRRVFGVSRLSPDLKAMVMLHVSKINLCPYCYQDHAPTLAQLGYSEDQIEALGEALPTEGTYGEVERAAIAFADEATRHAAVSRWTYERAEQLLTPEQLVELTVLVGVCNLIARFINAFEVEPNSP